MNYQKINPQVEAKQWTNDPENFSDLLAWSGSRVRMASPLLWGNNLKDFDIEVQTPSGAAVLHLGDWIIKHTEDVFYPCTKETFQVLYVAAHQKHKGEKMKVFIENLIEKGFFDNAMLRQAKEALASTSVQPQEAVPDEQNLLDEIDSELMQMEDYTHGEQGKKITELRRKISARTRNKLESVKDIEAKATEYANQYWKPDSIEHTAARLGYKAAARKHIGQQP